jgi:hypothetical protein
MRFDTLSSAIALIVGSIGVGACLYLLFCVRFANVQQLDCVADDHEISIVSSLINNQSVSLQWQKNSSSCSNRLIVRDCLLNVTRVHGNSNAIQFNCFALDDEIDNNVYISTIDAELALANSAASSLSWILFIITSIVLCLPCCFVGGSLMCCLAFGFDIPILNRLARFRCDVPVESKQV